MIELSLALVLLLEQNLHIVGTLNELGMLAIKDDGRRVAYQNWVLI